MATEVDLCNLALASLGDRATVSSINPPEGSIQAEHCARFYPIARDSLLEMHTWGFSTRRVQLAQVTNSWSQWLYAYVQPVDALNLIEILDPTVLDDYSATLQQYTNPAYSTVVLPTQVGGYVPQPFTCEVDAAGNQLILCNVANAELRYSAQVSDTTSFSPLFINTLVCHLASMLAGPVIKGEAGAAESKRCMAMMQFYLEQAEESDANQRKIAPQHKVAWIGGR